MKEKLEREGMGFLCILGMTSPIKFETICVFLMTIEKFLQLNYSKKASCCYKPSDDNWKNHCDHLQKILTNATKENTLYFVTGDFNLNCLEFHQSSEIRQFFNNMFEKRAFQHFYQLRFWYISQKRNNENLYFRLLRNICSN